MYQSRQQSSSITTAASSAVEAISALANAASAAQSSINSASLRLNKQKLNENSLSIKNYVPLNRNTILNANIQTSLEQNQAQIENSSNELSNDKKNSKNISNGQSDASFNLSGDRVVMSNVAGSRRPVAGGYSFF